MEDSLLKYLAFNQIFNARSAATSLLTIYILKPKTILLYLKLLQRKGTLDNYWLTNLKFLKANIIQMKMKFNFKTNSRN